jgi:hypothetical protein
MSSRNSPTLILDVRLRRTERYVAVFALVASGCGAALLETPYALAVGVLGVALVGVGLWRAGWLGSRHRLTSVSWQADGSWLLAESGKNIVRGELAGDSRLTRGGAWLRWRTERGLRRSLLLTRADVPEMELRRLLARLRIEATERALPEPPRA